MSQRFNPNKFVPCRYFLQNQCRKGNSCEFSHDFDTPTAILSDGPPPCAFFLNGHCARGDTCKFPHLTKKEIIEKERRKKKKENQNLSGDSGKGVSKGCSPKESVKVDPNLVTTARVPFSFADAVGNHRRPFCKITR